MALSERIFKDLMDGLAISKQTKLKDQKTIELYYSKLAHLENITEVFNQATITDFKTFFPSISDLYTLHKNTKQLSYKQQKKEIKGRVPPPEEGKKLMEDIIRQFKPKVNVDI